ncbi:alcohol oxidase [Agrocybe pediades]|nr:alcohol oxidase [Agrocybe pediades]
MNSTNIENVVGKLFDYIIIGGGTAGLTLATRLSENPSVSVLVLEAGDANLNDAEILTPAAFGIHFGRSQYDWNYSTVLQKNANNRTVNWPRGKGLGGSSSINWFQYHIPARGDIDAFERLGNRGWNWDLFKKYHMRSEHFIEPTVKHEAMSYDLAQHGTHGPLTVGYPLTLSGIEKPYQDTLATLGIQLNKEPFSGDIKGTWLTPISVDPKTRTRSYAANRYYAPNASRTNLTVLTLSPVSKIKFEHGDNGTLTATGVLFMHDGKEHVALVGKEVILSSGTIANPKILELSGVGDQDILKEAGVEVNLHLPGVGRNVQEHAYCGITYEVRPEKQDEILTFDCLLDPTELAKQAALFAAEGTGVLGMSFSTMTFVPLGEISKDASELYTKLEESITAGIAAGKYPPSYVKQYKLQLERIREKFCDAEFTIVQTAVPGVAKPGKKYISLSALTNHPFSRGTIHIKSSDPSEMPTIDPHYFEEEHDVRLFAEIMKFNRRVAKSEPLKSFLIDEEVYPGLQYGTDEQIIDFLKSNFLTSYHPVGSCSMLPQADNGVVDTNLKVYNTSNLRVVDTSIVPLHIAAHLQTTAYALGEIAADLITGKLTL